MPYGAGYTDKELAELQAAYAATDDDATYEVPLAKVTLAKGTKLTVTGINSARVVAGAEGTYRKVDQQR